MVIYMYIALGKGQIIPCGQFFFQKYKSSLNLLICCKFFYLITLYQFFKRTGAQIRPCCKIGQGQPRVTICINLVELESPMLHAKFQNHRTSSSGEEDFKGFYHIWAWRPSWSCDLDHLYKLSFPLPKEAPHENWL